MKDRKSTQRMRLSKLRHVFLLSFLIVIILAVGNSFAEGEGFYIRSSEEGKARAVSVKTGETVHSGRSSSVLEGVISEMSDQEVGKITLEGRIFFSSPLHLTGDQTPNRLVFDAYGAHVVYKGSGTFLHFDQRKETDVFFWLGGKISTESGEIGFHLEDPNKLTVEDAYIKGFDKHLIFVDATNRWVDSVTLKNLHLRGGNGIYWDSGADEAGTASFQQTVVEHVDWFPSVQNVAGLHLQGIYANSSFSHLRTRMHHDGCALVRMRGKVNLRAGTKFRGLHAEAGHEAQNVTMMDLTKVGPDDIYDIIRIEGYFVGSQEGISTFRGAGNMPMITRNTSRDWRGGTPHPKIVEEVRNISDRDYELRGTQVEFSNGLSSEKAHIDSFLNLEPLSSPPSGVEKGTIAMSDGENWDVDGDQSGDIVVYNGSKWKVMTDLGNE